MPDGFLSVESCILGPLTILDRWYVYVCESNFDRFSTNDKRKEEDEEEEEKIERNDWKAKRR